MKGRTELRFFSSYSTISLFHLTLVRYSVDCDKSSGSCVGASRDKLFSYSLFGLPDEKPQYTPGSSPSTIVTVYGHSYTGYAIVAHRSSFLYHWQRPALHIQSQSFKHELAYRTFAEDNCILIHFCYFFYLSNFDMIHYLRKVELKLFSETGISYSTISDAHYLLAKIVASGCSEQLCTVDHSFIFFGDPYRTWLSTPDYVRTGGSIYGHLIQNPGLITSTGATNGTPVSQRPALEI